MEKQTTSEAEAIAMLRAHFKSWKDSESSRILCNTWATPEGIEAMWTHIREQEKIFEKSLTATAGQNVQQTKRSGSNQP